ncbi:glycosyltransferase family 87 protein [Roseibium sp.]|uniref:glycosyltransferase family 87 protein n=1 Tax=Roseibium sp. TaxID=1936156 RepID=UPI003D1530DB
MKSTVGSNPQREPGTFRYGLRMSDPVADSVLMFVLTIIGALMIFRFGFEVSKVIFPEYRPMFGDFISFWTASAFVLDGAAADAYDFSLVNAFQLETFDQGGLPFLYPPTWLMVISPFSVLPYRPSALLFEAIQVTALIIACRFLLRDRSFFWILIVFPTVISGVIHGQNSVLNTALMAGALAALDRHRPILAGVLIGLLSYKPQLGILIPIALLAGREYRAFASAAVTTLAFAATSWVVLGTEVWRAFFETIAFASNWVEVGQTPANKYASMIGWLRQFGVGNTAGLIAQIGFAAVSIGAVVWAWRQDLPTPLKGSLLVLGTCLATPYLLDYDLALLAIPVMLLIQQGNETGYLEFEKPGIALSVFSLLFSSIWGVEMDVTAVGVPSIVLFVLVLRRAIAGHQNALSRASCPA